MEFFSGPLNNHQLSFLSVCWLPLSGTAILSFPTSFLILRRLRRLPTFLLSLNFPIQVAPERLSLLPPGQLNLTGWLGHIKRFSDSGKGMRIRWVAAVLKAFPVTTLLCPTAVSTTPIHNRTQRDATVKRPHHMDSLRLSRHAIDHQGCGPAISLITASTRNRVTAFGLALYLIRGRRMLTCHQKPGQTSPTLVTSGSRGR